MRKKVYFSIFSMIFTLLILTNTLCIAETTSEPDEGQSYAPKNALFHLDFELDNPVYYNYSSGNSFSSRDDIPKNAVHTVTAYKNMLQQRMTGDSGRFLGIYDEDTDEGFSANSGKKAGKFAINGYRGGIAVNPPENYTGGKLYLFRMYIKSSEDNTKTDVVSFRPCFDNPNKFEMDTNKLYVYNTDDNKFYDQSTSTHNFFEASPSGLKYKINKDNTEWGKIERVFYLEEDGKEWLGIGNDNWNNVTPIIVYVDDISVSPYFCGITGSDSITVTHGEAKTEAFGIETNSDIEVAKTLEWSVEGENPYVEIDNNGVLKIEPYANVSSVTIAVNIKAGDSKGETLKKTISVDYTGTPVPYATNPEIKGTLAVGETLEATYNFLKFEGIGEDDSEIEWLISDSYDSGYEKALSGKNFEIKSEHKNKWIKASITPKDKDGHINSAKIETEPVSLPSAPIAKNVEITGSSRIGEELSGKYDYYDFNDNGINENEKENGSVFAWYRYDSLKSEPVKISDEQKYTLTSDDVCKYLRFGVIPKNNGESGDKAEEVLSEFFTCPVPPVVTDVKIKGTVKAGGTLTGEYKYNSAVDISEANSIYEWTVDGKLYSDKISITVTEAMNGKKLKFTVTPVAALEPYKGEPVSAEISVSFKSQSYKSNGSTKSGTVTPSKPIETENNNENKNEENNSAFEFTDINGHWAEASIKRMAESKIINGYSDKTFKPNSYVKRSEAVTIAVNGFEISQKESKSKFFDIKEDDWFYSAVMAAASNNVINGFEGNFLPENNITRQEFAVIIMNIINLYPQINIPKEEKELFSDDAQISDWAKEAVYKVYSMNIMQGDNNCFRPEDFLTRAEATVTIERLKNILEK